MDEMSLYIFVLFVVSGSPALQAHFLAELQGLANKSGRDMSRALAFEAQLE